MKFLIIYIFISGLFALAIGFCDSQNYVNDPLPWGGASCLNNTDCGGIGGGECKFINNTGTCVCPTNRAKPDCSYNRTDPNTPGALNIALAFIGIGGIGNLMIRRIGQGAGQLVLGLMFWICAIVFVILASKGCCDSCENSNPISFVAFICLLAGLIWSTVDGVFILLCEYPDASGYAMT